MRKVKAGARQIPPTSLEFVKGNYSSYKRGKKPHRHYLDSVCRLVTGKTPKPTEWSTLIIRRVYLTLRAQEAGGVTLLPLNLRQQWSKAYGRIPYSAEDLQSMRLAEMTYTDLIPATSPTSSQKQEGIRKVSKAENEFAVDSTSIFGWADWCGSNGVSTKGFKAIMETGIGLKSAIKERGLGVFNSAKKYQPEVHPKTDAIPVGVQEILQIGIQADPSGQPALVKLLKLPVNVAEVEKANKAKAKAHKPLIPAKTAKKAEPAPAPAVKAKAKAKPAPSAGVVKKKAKAAPVEPVKVAAVKKKAVAVKKSFKK